MNVLTEVLDGTGPEILSDADGKVVGGGENLHLVLVILIVLILIILVGNLLALLAELALLLLLLEGSLVLLLSDAEATETEPGKEADAIKAGALHLGLELLLGLGVIALAGLVVLPDLVDEVQHAAGQVLVGLPVDLDRLADEARPAILVAAPPELLLENLVLKVLVLAELELDGNAARVAVGKLESLNREVDQRAQQDGRVSWLNILVDIRGSLLEDEGPEVGDLCNNLGALGVQVLGELSLLADCGFVNTLQL